jgi:hypothetical protein
MATLICILKVLGSNLSLKTGSSALGFQQFSHLYRQMPGQYLKLCHDHFLSHPFQHIIYLSFDTYPLSIAMLHNTDYKYSKIDYIGKAHRSMNGDFSKDMIHNLKDHSAVCDFLL